MTPKERAEDLAKRLGLSEEQCEAVRREIREAVNEEVARRAVPPKKQPIKEALWLGQEELDRGIG